MKQPYLIASYPKSGNTWLKFILANLFYPEIEHDFSTVNYYIPEIGGDNIHIKEGMPSPLFYKTHYIHNGSNIIFLHRHVGDTLISHWWHNRKFHNDQRSIYEWIIAVEYGKNWREHINHYFPSRITISYEELKKDTKEVITVLLKQIGTKKFEHEIETAIEKSSFENMQKAEEKGYGLYESAEINRDISFVRSGTVNQWADLDGQIQNRIIAENYKELRLLGYA